MFGLAVEGKVNRIHMIMVDNMDKNGISIIIPAYQPDDKLISTIKDLVEAGFADILVVDDGSDKSLGHIFEKVQKFPECTLLRHQVNRGKGAALKTAMAYFLENRKDSHCVVTVDADGQHLAKDIAAVSKAAVKTDKVVLGVRNFSDMNIPARSVAGNRITSAVFRLFFGMKIKDTQTGLRAFPKRYLSELMCVDGERYEYETNMLFFMNRQNIPFEQVDITTVYIEENKSSHFRVVRDSIRIYSLIFKYLLSSVAAAVIDELLFYIFKKFAFLTFLPIPLTFTAAILARVFSSLANFWINAKHVFGDTANKKALIKYYILATVQIAASAALVFLAEHIFRISSPALSTLVKMVVDTILFFISFRIQHKWVFNSGRKEAI